MSLKGKALVDEKIKLSKEKKLRVLVFSKSYCPFCTKAKKALAGYVKNIPDQYDVIEIENLADCAEIQDYLLKLTGGRSVPRVFIDGEFIGGGDETEAAHRSGKLRKLLG